MTIGERIKQRRLELNWSQRELATRMKYSHHSTLARIETGKVDVSQTRIVQFSKVLGVSIAYLMGWEDEEKQKQPAESELSIQKKELIEKVMQMSDEELQKLDLLLQIVESK
jgi:transcriptional regulator with XRE-family HTH domain